MTTETVAPFFETPWRTPARGDPSPALRAPSPRYRGARGTIAARASFSPAGEEVPEGRMRGTHARHRPRVRSAPGSPVRSAGGSRVRSAHRGAPVGWTPPPPGPPRSRAAPSLLPGLRLLDEGVDEAAEPAALTLLEPESAGGIDEDRGPGAAEVLTGDECRVTEDLFPLGIGEDMGGQQAQERPLEVCDHLRPDRGQARRASRRRPRRTADP
jgi:hypothetical protein